MENIPEEDLIEHEKQKLSYSSNREGDGGDSDSQDSDSSRPAQPALPKPPPAPTGAIHGPLPHMPPLPPPPLPSNAPPNLHQMMMMNAYQPYMMGMGMNPLMHMIPPPGGAPSTAAAAQTQPAQIQPLMQTPTQQPPQPLMGTAVTAPNAFNTSSIPPLLPPSQPTLPPPASKFNQPPPPPLMNDQYAQSQPGKIDNSAPGSKIVHPEDDISLVSSKFIYRIFTNFFKLIKF